CGILVCYNLPSMPGPEAGLQRCNRRCDAGIEVKRWCRKSSGWRLVVGCSLLALGFWLLAFGSWLLAVRFWLLAVGSWLFCQGRLAAEPPVHHDWLRCGGFT